MSAQPHTKPSIQAKETQRIALVCDWLTTPGGAEKVLLELHHMYPDAPIYTSQYNKKGITWFNGATVKTGWLQIFPSFLRKFLGPLRQIYFSHLDLSDYDLVISVTGAEAKAVRTQPKESINKLKKKSKSVSLPHKNPRRLPRKHPIPLLYHTSNEKSIANAKEAAKTYTKTEIAQGAAVLSGHAGARHICYCHVPTQYYWQMYDKYLENPGFGLLNPLVRFCFKLLVKPLRQADFCAAQQPDQFITISSYAQQQIKKYYQREAVIVAPPVEIAKFQPHSSNTPSYNSDLSTEFPQQNGDLSTDNPTFSTQDTEVIHKKSTRNPQQQPRLSTEGKEFSTSFPHPAADFPTETQKFPTSSTQLASSAQTSAPIDPYFIIACRQVTWKRVDLAISACLAANLHLKVVGAGPEHDHLVRLTESSSNIEFVPWCESGELARLLQHAQGYIFPSLEPFGIVAVEALAAGCPVIAYREGGSRDFIQPGRNGLLFDYQTVDSLVAALNKFQHLDFNKQTIIASAAKFSPAHFRQGILSSVDNSKKGPKP